MSRIRFSYEVKLGSVLNSELAGPNHTYGLFGEQNASTALPSIAQNSSPVNYAYAGYDLDLATGCYHNGPRVYCPTIGRWLSQESLGAAADENAYRYVHNRPVSMVDPSGYSDAAPEGGGGHAGYESEEDAARAFIREFNPVSIAENTEYSGIVARDNATGKYGVENLKQGTATGTGPLNFNVYPKETATAWAHTHAAYDKKLVDTWGNNGNEIFSDDDKKVSKGRGKGYLGTPFHEFKIYDPRTGQTTCRGRTD